MLDSVPTVFNANGNVNTGCGRVLVKFPNFWPNNTSLFFVQLEASFKLVGIFIEKTKFDHLVASLDVKTRNIVRFRYSLYTVVRESVQRF